ncbi:MAG: gamma carbonic anhydrase family protein [Desulfomonilia bacterium]|jgi:carbonic anhydrase/acetyltransferase-like protein (isoleucine patch superfamily)
MIASFGGKKPRIGKDVFIAPTACIIGDVEIGEGTSIWYGAVIRGDRAKIRIGKNTNIQDNVTMHADPDSPLVIGDYVTIGHNAVIHGCTIGDDCLIGMGTVILNDAHVQSGSVVASGSLVKEGSVIGAFRLAAGSPAEIKRELGPESSRKNRQDARKYRELARDHRRILEEAESSGQQEQA